MHVMLNLNTKGPILKHMSTKKKLKNHIRQVGIFIKISNVVLKFLLLSTFCHWNFEFFEHLILNQFPLNITTR
jgi:hypothetical protein